MKSAVPKDAIAHQALNEFLSILNNPAVQFIGSGIAGGYGAKALAELNNNTSPVDLNTDSIAGAGFGFGAMLGPTLIQKAIQRARARGTPARAVLAEVV